MCGVYVCVCARAVCVEHIHTVYTWDCSATWNMMQPLYNAQLFQNHQALYIYSFVFFLQYTYTQSNCAIFWCNIIPRYNKYVVKIDIDNIYVPLHHVGWENDLS